MKQYLKWLGVIILALGCRADFDVETIVTARKENPNPNLTGNIDGLEDFVYPLDGTNEPVLQGSTFTSPTPTHQNPVAGTFTCTFMTPNKDPNDPNFAAPGTQCSTLPSLTTVNATKVLGTIADGTTDASFNANTGVLVWTPTETQRGTFRFTIGVSDLQGGMDFSSYHVTVREKFSTTNFVDGIDASNSMTIPTLSSTPSGPRISFSGNDSTSLPWLTLKDTSFSFASSYSSFPWTGTGQTTSTTLSPYALEFRGNKDKLDLGSTLTSETEIILGVWAKFTSLPDTNGVLLGNGGGSGDGFVLQHSPAEPTRLEFLIGAKGSYQADVLAENPIGYWRLNETAGQASDLSGAFSCNGGNCDGNVSGATRGFGGGLGADADTAYRFDGINDQVNVVSFPLPLAGDFTAMVWFKRASFISTSMPIIGQGNLDTTDEGWSIQLASAPESNKLFVRVNTSNDATEMAGQVFDSPITDENWHHVALVFDRTAGTVLGYLDGSNTGWSSGGPGPSGNSIAGFGSMDTNEDLTFGAVERIAVASHFFSGVIDEVTILTTAATAAQIQGLYQSGVGGRTTTSLTVGRHYFIGIRKNENQTELSINGHIEDIVENEVTLTAGSTNLILGALSDGTRTHVGEVADFKYYGTTDGTDPDTASAPATLFEATANRFRETPVESILKTNISFHFDAHNADMGTHAYSNGCAPSDLIVQEIGPESLRGQMGNFDTCNTFGWQTNAAGLNVKVLEFDGANSLVSFPTNRGLSFTAGANSDLPFSVEAWVNADAVQPGQVVILRKGDNGLLKNEWHFGLDAARNPELIISHADNFVNRIGVTSGTALAAGTWNHVVATYDASATPAGMILYINGVVVATAAINPGAYTGMTATDAEMYMGTGLNGGAIDATSALDGRVSISRVYNKVLSLEEVKQNCLAQELRFTAVAQTICAAP